mmetsp:Transcript_6857/g.18524  ORF Transcript_6857/g.18524 Transcript_6857/m.18524 type:complete len:217 (-) Transcript_6857:355-1005(-)
MGVGHQGPHDVLLHDRRRRLRAQRPGLRLQQLLRQGDHPRLQARGRPAGLAQGGRHACEPGRGLRGAGRQPEAGGGRGHRREPRHAALHESPGLDAQLPQGCDTLGQHLDGRQAELVLGHARLAGGHRGARRGDGRDQVVLHASAFYPAFVRGRRGIPGEAPGDGEEVPGVWHRRHLPPRRLGAGCYRRRWHHVHRPPGRQAVRRARCQRQRPDRG